MPLGYEVFTGNTADVTTVKHWGKLIGDVPSATAILDLFLHHAEMTAITGRSYRLQKPGIAPEHPNENTP
jgi:hypothetical protein